MFLYAKKLQHKALCTQLAVSCTVDFVAFVLAVEYCGTICSGSLTFYIAIEKLLHSSLNKLFNSRRTKPSKPSRFFYATVISINKTVFLSI